MMRSGDREWYEVALDRLSRLADELRKIGLTAELLPGRRPFPGLAVWPPPGDVAARIDHPRPGDVIRVPIGAVMILTGSAHYWRQRSNGDLQLVGLLEEPAGAAKKILNHLSSQVG